MVSNEKLKSSELSPWVHGGSDQIIDVLMNGFSFLQQVTTEKKDGKYIADGVDVTAFYTKVYNNIFERFGVKANHRISLLGSKEDASALLGAYFRARASDKNIQLTEEQLQAVYAFIYPYVKVDARPDQFLDSFSGNSPSERHKKVLLYIIFDGVSEAERNAMFKEKYKDHVDKLLDAMISVVDFMRTPFRILNNEEGIAKEEAKVTGEAVKTSGIDLQWISMLNAFKQSLTFLLEQKTKGQAKNDAEALQRELQSVLLRCQGSFGVENERYKHDQQIQEREQMVQDIIQRLGFSEENALEQFDKYIADFRASMIQATPGKADEINKMPLVLLISHYAETWQALLDAKPPVDTHSQKEIDQLQNELEITKENLSQQTKSSMISQEEVERLAVENTNLKQQVTQLAQTGQPPAYTAAVQEDTQELQSKKIKLSAKVGKLVLNNANETTLLDNITASNDRQSLAAIEKTVKTLENINGMVKKINDGILSRAGFFSSDPHKKTVAINKAFNALSLEEKISLVQLTHEEIQNKSNDKDNIGQFLQEIKRSRGFIAIGEVTSFKHFKEQIQELGKEEEITSQMKPTSM